MFNRQSLKNPAVKKYQEYFHFSAFKLLCVKVYDKRINMSRAEMIFFIEYNKTLCQNSQITKTKELNIKPLRPKDKNLKNIELNDIIKVNAASHNYRVR